MYEGWIIFEGFISFLEMLTSCFFCIRNFSKKFRAQKGCGSSFFLCILWNNSFDAARAGNITNSRLYPCVSHIQPVCDFNMSFEMGDGFFLGAHKLPINWIACTFC